jgi:UDP-N-acetylglucosamine 2-epimerase (non-hydrolysing)
MSTTLRVMTVVGTRPEIIRLSRTMSLLREIGEHVLVHTGQNYDYELNDIFFDELSLARPDVYLGIDTSSVASAYAGTLLGVDEALERYQPNAVLILGDTNSSIAALVAKRRKIAVYHMEAGNRSFDRNVPEEINRQMVDHISDFNLAYTEHARRNLLREGLEPRRVSVTGSPLPEVVAHYQSKISQSRALEELKLQRDGYLLVSLHREENVDSVSRLNQLVNTLREAAQRFQMPVVVSTHPRTRRRLGELAELDDSLRFHKPFGYLDYMALQKSAFCVLSDSGTISEESTIADFPAVTLRSAIERPEAIEAGNILVSGIEASKVIESIESARLLRLKGPLEGPEEYRVLDTSRRVASFILSTYHVHYEWSGIRA